MVYFWRRVLFQRVLAIRCCMAAKP